jgi:hypothetical protein
MAGDRRRLRGAERRFLKGYAPLVVLVSTLVVMVAVVPSTVPDELVAGGRSPVVEVASGEPATGWGDRVTPCDDREEQVPDLGYSPPCFAFSGGNGGATTRGVTGDAIRVTYRMTADPHLVILLGQLGGVPQDESTAEVFRTMEALVEYANANFQFYGRKIELVPYDGRGQVLPEFVGAGQDAANNDGIRVADDIGAFADITGNTQPYADALARKEVVAIGAPYMSRQWYEARRPFAWSQLPDCSVTARAAARYANGRLFGRPAVFAGGDLAAEERTISVVAPNNLEYQQCVDDFEAQIKTEGNEVALRLDYILDPAQLKTQAASLMAKLHDAGNTSVACACDPIMQMYLAQEATAIGYYPEWLISGVGFIDWDLGGQIIAKNAPEQWVRAFGGSPASAPVPPERSIARAAYRSVRADEPSVLVEELFNQLLILAIGIQMAGPDLTADTFQTGLFSYPGGTGQAGTWDFGPSRYTPVVDLREIWWDPQTVSAFNGESGTYRDLGRRWPQDDIPAGEPEVFP